MSDDAALFGDDEPSSPADARPTPVAAWQIDLLRKALDDSGLASMAERQQAVQTAAGRAVSSLRQLTHDEAIAVLARLGRSRLPRERSASLWESRDKDTWIDRL